jgi:hypothetical protein
LHYKYHFSCHFFRSQIGHYQETNEVDELNEDDLAGIAADWEAVDEDDEDE